MTDGQWTVILPCAGALPANGSRPKWLLTVPTGELLLRRAVDLLPAGQISRVIITLSRAAEAAYNTSDALRRAFGREIEVLVLDEPTDGPSHTVAETIARTSLQGALCVKDPDTLFHLPSFPASNFIAVSDLHQQTFLSLPAAKSYVQLNEQGLVADVVEKSVSSNLISVGAYGFTDASGFSETFERLTAAFGHKKLYVSHILADMVFAGQVAEPCLVTDFVDISTLADWNAYRARHATLFLDIDGVIVRNQSRFFAPFWGSEVQLIAENVNHLLQLQAGGAQFVFVTARPEEFRPQTTAALQAAGLKIHALVMDCHHSTRYLVNDYSGSASYPSAVAINVERNKPELPRMLLADLLHRSDEP